MSSKKIPFSILVTSISKKVPLIMAAKTSLSDEILIHGSDTDPKCLARYFVDYFLETPLISQWTQDFVVEYCKHHRIQAIIPTRNGDLPFFAKYRSKFEEQGISSMVSSEACIDICLDKLKFAEWANKHHFPVIQTDLNLNQIHVPQVVVKDRFGAGSKALFLNVTKKSAENLAKEINNPIFQPYIQGQEYSIDLYRDKNGIVKGCVSRKRDLVVSGESQVTTTVRKPKMEQLCATMADALGIYGHAVFQVLESSEGALHVIECNPRFGGASTCSLAAGLETFSWFLMESQGTPLPSFKRVDGEIKQVRYPTDKIIKVS